MPYTLAFFLAHCMHQNAVAFGLEYICKCIPVYKMPEDAADTEKGGFEDWGAFYEHTEQTCIYIKSFVSNICSKNHVKI